MQTALDAINEPHRREILRLVRDRELAAGEIAARFEVTRPTISQHLTVLKNAGLITERRDGTRRLYSARREGLVALRTFLAGVLDVGLAGGRREVEKEKRKGRVAGAASRN